MLMSRILILILSVMVAASAGAKAPSYDVVFDLDWTLFYPSKTPHKKDTFLFNGEYFRMADGSAEVIAKLHAEAHRVSLFSGGQRLRNHAAAEFLLLKLKELGVKDFRFEKVLSFEDLGARPGASSTAKFSERYMKDLKPYFANLQRVVLVDDLANFFAPGQEKNLYALGKTYAFRESFTKESIGAYDPPTEDEWRRERRKILNFYELFHQATVESSSGDALGALQALRAGASLCSKVF
jgi:hypothetical protein